MGSAVPLQNYAIFLLNLIERIAIDGYFCKDDGVQILACKFWRQILAVLIARRQSLRGMTALLMVFSIWLLLLLEQQCMSAMQATINFHLFQCHVQKAGYQVFTVLATNSLATLWIGTQQNRPVKH